MKFYMLNIRNAPISDFMVGFDCITKRIGFQACKSEGPSSEYHEYISPRNEPPWKVSDTSIWSAVDAVKSNKIQVCTCLNDMSLDPTVYYPKVLKFAETYDYETQKILDYVSTLERKGGSQENG